MRMRLSIDRLSGVGASAGFCLLLLPWLGVVRCGRSAGCVLCVLWAISRLLGCSVAYIASIASGDAIHAI